MPRWVDERPPRLCRRVTLQPGAHAGVSRSWLYAQPDLRTEIDRLRTAHRRAPASPVPARQRASDASLLRRLEAAQQRIRHLAEENRQLREHLAQALGQQRVAHSARARTGHAGERAG
jgi:Family of unknown function (DUF6262)